LFSPKALVEVQTTWVGDPRRCFGRQVSEERDLRDRICFLVRIKLRDTPGAYGGYGGSGTGTPISLKK